MYFRQISKVCTVCILYVQCLASTCTVYQVLILFTILSKTRKSAICTSNGKTHKMNLLFYQTPDKNNLKTVISIIHSIVHPIKLYIATIQSKTSTYILEPKLHNKKTMTYKLLGSMIRPKNTGGFI